MKQHIHLLTFFLLTISSFVVVAQNDPPINFDIQGFLNTTTNSSGISRQDVANWVVTDNHISTISGVQHIYLKQTYQGIEIVDATADLHVIDKKTAPLSYHNRFFPNIGLNIARANSSNDPKLNAVDAVNAIAKQFGYKNSIPIEVIKVIDASQQKVLLSKGSISLEDIPAKLVYQNKNKELKLAWDLAILELDGANWWNIRVDAFTGEVLEQINWTLNCNFGKPDICSEDHVHHIATPTNAKAATSPPSLLGNYHVYAVPLESPNHGERTIVIDPADPTASPYGWHDTNGADGAEFTITRGNNVHSYEDNSENPIDQYSPDGGSSLNFDFPIDLTQAPLVNEDANITNLFYWNNIIHDVAYHMGFDETSGNFQENNYGKGGLGSDYVEAEAQDGGGSNNANFATPPDGSNPRMQMFLWTAADPDIDGDLDNGIILHEYGHGISNRLTGGPSNTGCLSNTEQMGEGWSDFFGLILTTKNTDQGIDKRGIGTYALNEATTGDGIRTYPYSTDLTINPHTYDNIKSGLSAPHGVGSVWCAMLWEMTWELIEEHGFEEDQYSNVGGNNIAMHLVMEGLKLQPCSPGFIDGRDAILKADTALYNGANSCLIWRAFSKRGLGYSASQGSSGSITDGSEAFDLPPHVNAECTNDPIYAVLINPSRLTSCPGEEFQYTVSVLAFNDYTGTVTISEDNIPDGAISSLSQTTFSEFPGTATLTISNTANLAAGDYSIHINGSDGSIEKQRTATLEIAATAGAPNLTSPDDGTMVASLVQTLKWATEPGANNYDLQMATDIDFNNLIIDEAGISENSYETDILIPNQTYYWRVLSNSCVKSAYNQYSFTVASACGQIFTDSGGPDGAYGDNELEMWIFCPDNEGETIQLTFSQFDIEPLGTSDCWDVLTIYDGNNTNAPSLGSFCGTSIDNLPNNGVLIANNSSGCLTFVFDSDASITRAGWEASISCLDCVPPIVTSLTLTPENCSGTDGMVMVTSSIPTNYTLTPVGENPITNSTGTFSNLAAGNYTLFLQNQSDETCISDVQDISITSISPTIDEIQSTPSICRDSINGSIIIISSFNANLDYILTPEGGTPISNNTGLFTNLAIGTYTAIVQGIDDPSCQSAIATTTINELIVDAPNPPNEIDACMMDVNSPNLASLCESNTCNTAFTIQPNTSIASNTTVCEIINVLGIQSPISELSLQLKIPHTYIGDLSATLESPNGTVIQLFNRPGCSQNNLNLILTDTASMTAIDLENTCNTSSETDTYAIEGTFQTIDLFANLNGETANGDWIICVQDHASGDVGEIEEVTLTLNSVKTTWWDAPIDGNLLFNGPNFNPIENGNLDPSSLDTYTYYAQCECNGCPSERTLTNFTIEGSFAYYDEDGDGYGDISNTVFVCDGETTPAGYVYNFDDCNDEDGEDVIMLLDQANIPPGEYQANESIISSGLLNTDGTLTIFQAGQSILLEPGFEVAPNSDFLAFIGICGEESLLSSPTVDALIASTNTTVSQTGTKKELPTNFEKHDKEIFPLDLEIFPNPFQNSTQIAFNLPKAGNTSLIVYDQIGRVVKSFHQNQWLETGTYQFTLDGKQLSSGMFFVILKTEESILTQRVIRSR